MRSLLTQLVGVAPLHALASEGGGSALCIHDLLLLLLRLLLSIVSSHITVCRLPWGRDPSA